MPKYYVRSGQLERVVIADTPKDAAHVAINRCSGEEIDMVSFFIDERGFRGPTPESPSFDSNFLPEFAFSVTGLMAEWEHGY